MPPTTVLIVDDVPDVRQELSLLLSLSADMIVLAGAANGLEAVQQAGRLHPDVILMDLEMPIMDGLEAARQIKDLLPGCRIIALTIHDSPESREMCAQSGMDDFLIKGCCLAALRKAIRPSDNSGETRKGDTE
jgi:two-component system nitrate/nitrite response regulator NarL